MQHNQGEIVREVVVQLACDLAPLEFQFRQQVSPVSLALTPQSQNVALRGIEREFVVYAIP